MTEKIITELTKEEMEMVLAERKKRAEETERLVRLELAKQALIAAYQEILECDGTVSIDGGDYVRTGAFLTNVRSTKKGIRFEVKK